MTRTDKIFSVVILSCAVLAIISLIVDRPDFICLFMGIGTIAFSMWPVNNNNKNEKKDEQQTSDSSKA